MNEAFATVVHGTHRDIQGWFDRGWIMIRYNGSVSSSRGDKEEVLLSMTLIRP